MGLEDTPSLKPGGDAADNVELDGPRLSQLPTFLWVTLGSFL